MFSKRECHRKPWERITPCATLTDDDDVDHGDDDGGDYDGSDGVLPLASSVAVAVVHD